MADFETHPVGTSEYIRKLEKALEEASKVQVIVSKLDIENNELNQEDKDTLRSYLNHHLLI